MHHTTMRIYYTMYTARMSCHIVLHARRPGKFHAWICLSCLATFFAEVLWRFAEICGDWDLC